MKLVPNQQKNSQMANLSSLKSRHLSHLLKICAWSRNFHLMMLIGSNIPPASAGCGLKMCAKSLTQMSEEEAVYTT